VSESDWDLVERAREGDRGAFRTLVERYQRKMAGLAVGMLRDSDDALDVVQDAFAKAYQNLGRFKGDSSFYTWLYRITVNLCIDHQRREGRMVRVSMDAPDDGDAPSPPTVSDESVRADPVRGVQDSELRRHLERAMAELTPEHRAVILLREVEGLSYDEIAQALDCPKGTVMSRLHYARRQLQDKLRELL
jgi:RNA polymerase sigma-70 factor (ECF subfamily)